MNHPSYPNHRVPFPKDDDYAGVECVDCSSPEVIWHDKQALEVECYECGCLYLLAVGVTHNNR
jgi:ribosomal protein S27E